MNYSIIVYILGWIMNVEAVCMLVPGITALIYREKAGIAFPDGTPYLELTCHRFPNFGIWSVPGSSFVCLEPWMGRCDDCGFKGNLSEKANINALNADEIFNASYEIKIY